MAKVVCKGYGGNLTGQVGSVRFTNGEGHTDNPGMLAYFRRQGDMYVVEPDEDGPQQLQVPDTIQLPEDEDAEGDPYDVTREQLRDMARERGLSTSGSRTELQDRLRAADAEDNGGE